MSYELNLQGDLLTLAKWAARAKYFNGRASISDGKLTLIFASMVDRERCEASRRSIPPAQIGAMIYVWFQNRDLNPPGVFDRQGRWFTQDYHPCCDRIRAPSINWPYSMLLHCRTAEHVAHVVGCTAKEIRAAAKAIRTASEAVRVAGVA